MSVGRRVSLLLAVLAAILVGVSADAQIGSLLKKRLPKPPSAPGATTPVPPTSASTPASGSLDCSQITDDLIDKFLKAQVVRKKVYDEEMAKANAKKAEADALTKRRAESMVDTTMKTEECKDAFKEKDPRSKEIARLEDQVAAADTAGDEAKSEALRKKLDPLNDALNIDADRACGGKGAAALHDCMEKKKATLAKQGVTEPMLSIQAQGECMQDPSTSGFAGATAASAEEDAASSMAADIMANADAKANQAEKEAGLDDKQRGLFIECVVGVLNDDPAVLAATPAGSKAAIQKRASELRKAAR
jgi:hypothetical protein